MAKRVIVLNDKTTHGGVVISGAANYKIEGRPIARLGDLVDCPLFYPDKKPHGVNKIIEGDPSLCLEGIPVALEGHHTVCGCALIASVSVSLG